jgi:hypothetical protein
LVFQPNIDKTFIGVIEEQGVVTLTRMADDYQKRSI